MDKSLKFFLEKTKTMNFFNGIDVICPNVLSILDRILSHIGQIKYGQDGCEIFEKILKRTKLKIEKDCKIDDLELEVRAQSILFIVTKIILEESTLIYHLKVKVGNEEWDKGEDFEGWRGKNSGEMVCELDLLRSEDKPVCTKELRSIADIALSQRDIEVMGENYMKLFNS